MATEIERLVAVIEARDAQFQKVLDRVNKNTDRTASSVERRLKAMNDRVSSTLSRGFGRLFGGLGAAFGSRELAGFTEAFTRIQNTLKVAGLSGDQLRTTYERLFAIAQRQGTAIEPLVQLFGRLSQSQKELGASNAELVHFTEGVATALRVQGGDASQAAGALLQLSQAMAGGVVRSEEFNSVIEGARPVLQAVANGLEEAGGSVAKLRQLVTDGKVSSEAFFRAFLAGMGSLAQQSASAEATVSQSFTRLKNTLIDAIGKLDDATGGSEDVRRALEQLASIVTWLGDRINDVKGPLSELASFFATIQRNVEAAGKAIGDFLGTTGVAPAIQEALGGPTQLTVTRPQTEIPLAATYKPVSLQDYPVTGGGGRAGSVKQARMEVQELSEEAKQAREYMMDLSDTGQSAFRGMVEALRDGKVELSELSDVLDSLVSRLLDMATNAIWQQAFGSLFTVGSPGFGGSPIGTIPGSLPGRAAGGPVSAGRAYMVGERGRELFIPRQSGIIVPQFTGSRGNSGPQTTVVVENNTGAPTRQERSTSGGRDLVKVIVGEVGKAMAQGDFDPVMRGRFGNSPVQARR